MKTFLKIIVLFALAGMNIANAQKVNIDSGLVAYYPFNGSADDASGNGHNGTVNGATLTTDRFGVAGKAYSFDGVSNYIQCNTIPVLDSCFTYAAWIKVIRPSGQDINNNFGCFGTPGAGVSTWDWGYNVNSEKFWIYDKTNTANGYTSAIGTDWKFVVVKYSGTARSIYLDGTLFGTPQNINTPVSSLPTDVLRIGCHTNNISQQFMGSIDDIRLYNRALTDDEISQLFISTAIPAYSNSDPVFELYPNPTNEKVYIKSGEAFQVKAFNQAGQQIFSGSSNDCKYVTLKQKGIYLFELTSGKNTVYKKVIVQ